MSPARIQAVRVVVRLTLIAAVGIPVAGAQVQAPTVPASHPVVQQATTALAAYLSSLTASVNGSAAAAQATGPANPQFSNSPPNASASVSVTLNWKTLPSPSGQGASTPKLTGYVVLRPSSARPGAWDSVAFVAAPPTQVQAQISPSSNALFRVAAHYAALTFSVSPNPNNSGQIVTGTNAQSQAWNADTTRAVRVITP